MASTSDSEDGLQMFLRGTSSSSSLRECSKIVHTGFEHSLVDH